MAPCFALSRLKFRALLSNRIKKIFGGGEEAGATRFPEITNEGNAAQCLALSRLRVGTLLSNRIKNFTGAGVKPERRSSNSLFERR